MRASCFVLFVSFLLQSCSSTFYVPPAHAVPGIRSKGEKILSINGGGGQANIHYAEGITDRLAFQTNASGLYFNSQAYGLDLMEGRDLCYGFMAEGALGYFGELGKGFHVELYGLGAVGRMSSDFKNDLSRMLYGLQGNLNANFYRIGIQPALHFSYKWLSIAGACSWYGLHYDRITGTLTEEGIDQRALLRSMAKSSLFESSLTARFGWNNFKFQLQYVHSRNLNYDDFPMQGSTGFLGVQYRF